MRHRVEEILLVASPYDSFVLEEEGQFGDRIFQQYLELNLSNSPRFTQVSTLRDARAALRNRHYDLVITTPNGTRTAPSRLAQSLKEIREDLPVVLLTYDRYSAETWSRHGTESPIDRVFLWTGTPRLLLSLVKSVEDHLNVDRDTRKSSVQVIVLVEDSPAFYSSYLPVIYTEILDQTLSLMPEGINQADRTYRMRARPKILLAQTYEEGRSLLLKHRQHLLGVVMDMRFPRKGQPDPKAGLASIKLIRRHLPDVPILLQSAEPDHAAIAEEIGVSFADKRSRDLLETLRTFMWEELGFGEFKFRLTDGTVVDRVNDVRDLYRALQEVPDETLRYHGPRQDLSSWLLARTEFSLANQFAKLTNEDFGDLDSARAYLVQVLADHLEQRQRGQVTDFVRDADHLGRDFTRIGQGSMGGKARGVAFASHQLARHSLHDKYPDVKITVPRTHVLCTEIFDRFVTENDLRERALHAESDEEVARMFLDAPLDEELTDDLRNLLSDVRYPLAVRSSSLYEDSAFEPLAGLYQTLVVPNSSDDDEIRLNQLSRAIRLVFASTFYLGPRATMDAGQLRMEEEKMAVMVQRLVGRVHGDRFYPHFAGVAQSHNYYPIRYIAPDDGIAAVCLGLGQHVVDGGRCLRFCPNHPQVSLQFSSTRDAQEASQRAFLALDLSDPDRIEAHPKLTRYDLSTAEEDGTLAPVGATWSADDDRIHDTIYTPGVRLVNFAQVLKYDRFPLAPLLADLLKLGADGLGSPVELEFAVALGEDDTPDEIALLQLRPLVAQTLSAEATFDASYGNGEPFMEGPAMGNGVIPDLRDVIYVHPSRFEPTNTREMARQIARMNAALSKQRTPYLLIAPGRWGTADPHLGIPVSWAEVSSARVMVELAFPGYRVQPSQGTHFFHNITSLQVAYFTIDLATERGTIDLEHLEAIAPLEEHVGVRHVRLPHPIEVRVDGRTSEGVAVLVK